MVSRVALGLALPLAAIAAWQIAGALGYEYLSSPTAVAAAMRDLISDGELFADLAHTLFVALLAALIATVGGGVVGFFVGSVTFVRRYLMAGIDVLRAVPATALVPVALLALGPAVHTEVVLAAYAAVWPVLLGTAAGVASVHPRQYDVARVLHLSRSARIRKIVLPAALPGWLAGARMAAIAALLVAIVAELIIWPRGLGGGLHESLQALDPARMWAYALTCGVVGVALNGLLRGAVRLEPRRGRDTDGMAQPNVPPRGLLVLFGALLVWQILAGDSWSLPPPSDWFAGLARLHDDGVLLAAIGHTVTTVVVGLALATLVGVAVGVAIGASVSADRALSPSVEFLAAVPAAAYVPVVVLLLGTSMSGGLVVVVLAASWPVLLETATAMRGFPAVRLDMSRTLGLTAGERWRKVVAPTLAPAILLGVRIAVAVALVVALLVDIVGAGKGIGRLLMVSQQGFDAATAWGLLLIVGGIGFASSVAVVRVESLVVRRPGRTAVED